LPPRPPTPFLTALLFGVLCLVWGSTWIVIKVGLADLPPFTSATWRFVVAFAVMAAIAPRLHRFEGGERPKAWLWLTLGATNFGASYGIVYWTSTLLPSGLVSVLWAVFPLIMAVAGHWFLTGERLGPAQGLGFVAGFAGVALLFLTDLQQFGPHGVPAAALLLLSPLVSAVGTVLVKRYGSGASSVLLNRNAMAVGAVMLGAIGLWRERGVEGRWSLAAIASVGYLAVFGTCLTFTLYYWLMRYARANRLSLIAFITPAIALTLGWAVGGEPVHAHTLGGALLIIVGVALVVRRR
jgi:drug/metabolite transporter (DMT)-like permease